MAGSMKGKVCIVTGANTGIGAETALGLAKLGGTVVMVCRDRDKGEEARANIVKRSGNAAVSLMIADLSSQNQIRRLAADFLGGRSGAPSLVDGRPRLDVLLHNAAAILPHRRVSVDGLEMQFAVNHLAPFLLTHLLLDVLKSSAPSRVVVVASQVESRGTLRWDDLQMEKGYTPLEAYFQSKLANVLFTYELARRLEGTGVTANCLHPGVISTNLLSDYMGRPRSMGFLNSLTNPGPEKGAKPSIRLASDPALATTTGKYFKEMVETKSSRASYDMEAARRLWDLSAQLTSSTSPG
ncbi:MAG: SDR family oxidoreductase [Polyangiaceae bacterium]|nr:SDR family oxidoreductase [Polyangiaceae bacterium]